MENKTINVPRVNNFRVQLHHIYRINFDAELRRMTSLNIYDFTSAESLSEV